MMDKSDNSIFNAFTFIKDEANKMQIGIFLILLSACTDIDKENKIQRQSAEIDSLIRENQYLKNALILETETKKNIEVVKENKKFAYVLITYSDQQYVPEKVISSESKNTPGDPPIILPPVTIPSHYESITKYWFSSVTEFKTFDDDIRSKFLDGEESQFGYLHNQGSISKRECFVFDSYSEASEDMQNRKRQSIHINENL